LSTWQGKPDVSLDWSKQMTIQSNCRTACGPTPPPKKRKKNLK
jgi:hypothetical protein